MRRLLTALVRLYQILTRSWMPPVCRFHPSCSDYTLQALHIHGALRGTFLGARRILRCHPFHPGGYDPVPPAPRAIEALDEQGASTAPAGEDPK